MNLRQQWPAPANEGRMKLLRSRVDGGRQNGELWIALAEYQGETGQVLDAMKTWEEAAANIKPTNYFILHQAQFMFLHGREDKAEELLQPVMKEIRETEAPVEGHRKSKHTLNMIALFDAVLFARRENANPANREVLQWIYKLRAWRSEESIRMKSAALIDERNTIARQAGRSEIALNSASVRSFPWCEPRQTVLEKKQLDFG